MPISRSRTRLSRSVCRYAATWIVCLVVAIQAFAATGYFIRKKIRIRSGQGAWDYSAVDEDSRRLFVARDTQVDVVNLDTDEPAGQIPDTKGAHAIALAPEFKHGFITNGDN